MKKLYIYIYVIIIFFLLNGCKSSNKKESNKNLAGKTTFEEIQKNEIKKDTLRVILKEDIATIILNNKKELIRKDTINHPSFNSIECELINKKIGILIYTYGLGRSIEKYQYRINLNDAKFNEALSYSVNQSTLSISNRLINVSLEDFSSDKLYELQGGLNTFITFDIDLNSHVKNGHPNILPYEQLIKNLYKKKAIIKLKLASSAGVYNILLQYVRFNESRYVNSFNNIAYYLEQSKLYKEAIFLLENIIKEFPKRTVAYINLGDSYWALNKKEKAKKMYNIYINQMKLNKKEAKIPEQVYNRVNK